MAIPYPSSPTVGQTFTYGGITYTWNGVAWVYTQTNTPAVVGSVAVTAPITNTGTPTAPVIGINQSALSIAESQVTNLVSDLAGKANLAGGNSFTGAQIIGTNGTANIGLVVIGTASQAANLQEWRISTGGTVARVDKNGAVSAQYFGPSGAGLLGYLDWTTSSPLFQTGGTAVVGIRIRGAASQSANLQEWQTSAGGTAARVDASGNFETTGIGITRGDQRIGTGSYFSAALNVLARATTEKGIVVRGQASQTANLLELQTSDGTLQTAFSSIGYLQLGAGTNPGGQLGIPLGAAANRGIVIRGAASQTADLQQWQNSAGGTASSVDAFGNAGFGGTAASSSFGLRVATNANPAVIGIAVVGAASQSADLQQWRNSAGGTVAKVTSAGDASFGAVALGNGTIYGSSSWLNIGLTNATQIGAIVKGAASQSANLQQWQNSAGGTVAKVDSVGDITGRVLRSTLAARIVTSDTTVAPMVISTIAGQTSNNTEWQTNAGTVSYIKADGSLYINSNSNTTGVYWKGTSSDQSIRANGNDLFVTPRFDLIYSPTDTTGRLRPGTDNAADLGTTGQRWKNLYATGAVLNSLSMSSTTSPILLNGSAGTTGQVLTSGGAGTTPTWTTVGGGGSFTGGTLTSDLVLAAGSTAVEPLTFQTNTSTVGTVSGAMEYDGTVFYQTSNTNPGKALATQNYYYVSNADYGPDFTINSTAKSLLDGATVGLTVAAGTTYEYELITAISHQYVTTTSISGDYLIVSTTVSGSPVVATTHQVDYGSNTTGFTTATTLSTVRPTGNVTFMPAITSGTRYAFLRAKGLIRVTGTGTVKIYPAMQTSGASGSGDNVWNVKAGTIFKLTPVGNGTVTQVGAFA